MRLNGKVAVVTGGGRGIGFGVATRLASEGASVAVADLDSSSAEAAAARLRDNGASAFGMAMDVADEASVERFFDATARELGPVSILIHSAAIWSNATVEQMPTDEWQRVMDINTRGTFLVCKRAMRDMVPMGSGRIVNIASTIFLSGGPGYSHYAASKGAVIAFSRALAGEAGPHGITVNCIAPGLIATEAALATHGKTGVAAVVGHQLINRAGSVEDIAEAVGYFVGPGAGFTTGQTLYVNGGTHFA
ncbi:SDR family NAD(P)-dependent oxidoreductase [Sphingobium fuliginis]|uniref:3-oxoacyl-[acyl-carrier protein] reductase n=1 Tax=Sphingobium fuliginis (strain ATCC 27551) TaxID=336203 RepID=A0A292ZFE8_SPHSA|nr:SDR family NAD(P)-dependent oxidoreductase [Sphingobium fuliginis]GAY22197.1 3-oxoacyl-[acyl-carrier protein] reductase [Sphingobium fuliginis]